MTTKNEKRRSAASPCSIAERALRIRVLDPDAREETALVAKRMRQTLMEVLGDERGRQLYELDWLENRVRQHLDPNELAGQVFLSEDDDDTITGHTMVRLDKDAVGNSIGLFSTIFVLPGHRKAGVGRALIVCGEPDDFVALSKQLRPDNSSPSEDHEGDSDYA